MLDLNFFAYLIGITVLISLIICEFNHLFIYLLVISVSSSVNAIHVPAQFLIMLSFPYWFVGVLFAFFIGILKLYVCKFLLSICDSSFHFFFFGHCWLFLVPCSMWDLSSPSRDRTCAPCSGSSESWPLGKSKFSLS